MIPPEDSLQDNVPAKNLFNIYSVHKHLPTPCNGTVTVAGASERAVSLADNTWSSRADGPRRRSFHLVISECPEENPHKVGVGGGGGWSGQASLRKRCMDCALQSRR